MKSILVCHLKQSDSTVRYEIPFCHRLIVFDLFRIRNVLPKITFQLLSRSSQVGIIIKVNLEVFGLGVLTLVPPVKKTIYNFF